MALYRCSREKQVNIGIVFANRDIPLSQEVAGCLINTLPLEIDFSENGFSDEGANLSSEGFIHKFNQRLNEYREYSHYSLIELLEVAQSKGNSSSSGLFQIIFASQYSADPLAPTFTRLEINNQLPEFDLEFNFYHNHEAQRLDIKFASAKYTLDYINSLQKTITVIINELAAAPDKAIKNIALIDNNDYHKLLYRWNQNQLPYTATGKTLSELFEEQVARTGEDTAIVYQKQQLTYAELNQKANQLAHYLRQNYQLKGDDLVAFHLERSEQVLITQLGILKAGAAYLPLDPTYPDERIKYILEDSRPKFLICNQAHLAKLGRLIAETTKLFAIDSKTSQQILLKEAITNPGLTITSQNLAYVIYTSGTTGKPKGVMLEHSGIVHLVQVGAKEFGLTTRRNLSDAQQNCLQYISYTFDVHVWEIFVVLAHGHQLHILAATSRLDLEQISEYVKDNSIYLATIPPALLASDKLLTVKKLVVIGEPTEQAVMANYEQKQVDIINAYGPTEATVYITLKRYALGVANTNIGKPIANSSCYVLDENLELLPIGMIGELYLGGIGLARGYLNKNELTAVSFIENPYYVKELENSHYSQQVVSKRLYKSGDLVRYLENGDIEFISRKDSQVKIRGQRVELGEIETALYRYNASKINGQTNYPIQQSLVLALNPKEKTSITDKQLVAYYISKEKVDEKLLEAYLASNLPAYMQPNCFIHLEKLPITINGKLDRNVLQTIFNNQHQENNKIVKPVGEIEYKMAELYAEILGLSVEQIGTTCDFFHLGGNSLRAQRLVTRINQELNLNLHIQDILFKKTIDNLLGERLWSDFEETENAYYLKAKTDEATSTIILIPGMTSKFECHYSDFARGLQKAGNYVIYIIKQLQLEDGNIEKLALDYIAQIAKLNLRKQRITLCGYSAGGELAYLMAAKLTKYRIDLIILDSNLNRNKAYIKFKVALGKKLNLIPAISWNYELPKIKLPILYFQAKQPLIKSRCYQLDKGIKYYWLRQFKANLEFYYSYLSSYLYKSIPNGINKLNPQNTHIIKLDCDHHGKQGIMTPGQLPLIIEQIKVFIEKRN